MPIWGLITAWCLATAGEGGAGEGGGAAVCGDTRMSCEAAGRSKGRGASWRKSGDVEESTTCSVRRFALKDIAVSGSIGNLMASHRCC